MGGNKEGNENSCRAGSGRMKKDEAILCVARHDSHRAYPVPVASNLYERCFRQSHGLHASRQFS